MKNTTILFLWILPLVVTLGCSSDDGAEPNPDTNPNPNKTTTYTADVKTIIDTHCIECHTIPLAQGAIFPMRNYAETINGLDRDLVLRITSPNISNIMPPSGRLPQETIDIILDWVADGELEE